MVFNATFNNYKYMYLILKFIIFIYKKCTCMCLFTYFSSILSCLVNIECNLLYLLCSIVICCGL